MPHNFSTSSNFNSSIQHPNRSNHSTYLDQKAELYSILKTSQILKGEYDRGRLKDQTYFRSMQGFYRDLTHLEQMIRSRGKNLRDLLETFPLGFNLKPMLSFITSISDYQYTEIANSWQLDPFMLAATSAEITSNFITLMDYLHLIEDIDIEFIDRLIQTLEDSLRKMAVFHPFAEQIEQIHGTILEILSTMSKSSQNLSLNEIRNIMTEYEESFYKIFFEFKETLSFSTN